VPGKQGTRDNTRSYTMNYSQCYAGPSKVARAASFFVVLALLFPAAAMGQNVVRVEEDWELEIGEPDVNSVGPQVLTTMSPNADLTGTYFTMEINHRSAPSWTPGGISIHRWTGEGRNASFDRADRTIMQTGSETVTWTQALYHDNGRLHFKVFNGISSTWGLFGYSSLLKLDTSWGTDHINNYTPAVSVAQSGAAYAGNRIHILKIKCIRVTLSDGSVLTDNTERIVQQLID
jgi:hypothetical protein